MSFKTTRNISYLSQLRQKFPQYRISCEIYKYGTYYCFYKSFFSLFSFCWIYVSHSYWTSNNTVKSYSENPDAIFVAKELDLELIITEE